MINNEIVQALKIIWDYMVLDQKIEKSDLIIGCGCKSLEIPRKCSELLKLNYANKILFAGGYGRITSKEFKKPEAEIYREIALKEGINEDQIYIENKSTNTGDNFRFSLKIIKENNIEAKKIIIVHNKMSERRTYSTAKAIIKDCELYITSTNVVFDEFINKIKLRTEKDVNDIISSILADVQRIIIYPQFGWQIENEVPDEVIKAYYLLKNRGFNKFIFNKDDIQKMIERYGIKDGEKPNYFN